MKLVHGLPLMATILATVAVAQSVSQGTFEGLWVARERYGPDVRGTLLIWPRNGLVRADIAGYSVPVRMDGQHLSFALPDDKGSFRGVISGNGLAGFWLQSERGWRYATPVELRAAGKQRWRGEVEPKMNRMTFYLPVARTADGHFATYLRNPERNQGRFIPVSELAVRRRDGATAGCCARHQ